MKLAQFPASGALGRLVPITLIQAVGLACGVVGVKITTWLVLPADYGAYGIFLTFTPLGMWVVHAGLIKFVGRHWAAAEDRAALLRDVRRAAVRKTPWLLLAAAGAAAAMAGHSWLAVVPFVFVAAALLSCGAIAQTALQAASEHWHDLAVSSTGSVTRSFLPPLLYAALGGSAFALYGGFCLHACALAFAGAWTLRAYWRTGATASRTLTPVYEGPLFVLLAVSAWALAGLNRWIMALFYGPTETGFFVLAGNLATLVPAMLGTIFVQYFQPGFFALGDSRSAARPVLARRVDYVALTFSVVALAGVGALVLVAPWLVGPVISPRYQPALAWLLPTGCFGTATITAVFFHSMLLAGRRERACAPVDLITAGVLATGCISGAVGGTEWFARWLVVTPLVPWVLTRPLARWFFFKPAADPTPAPAP